MVIFYSLLLKMPTLQFSLDALITHKTLRFRREPARKFEGRAVGCNVNIL